MAGPRSAAAGAGTTPRLSIRVRPGGSRTRVGGRWGDDDQPGGVALGVTVTARAVDGAANAAVCEALAAAVGVRPRQVWIVVGARSRSKVVEIDDAPADLSAIVARLLDS